MSIPTSIPASISTSSDAASLIEAASYLIERGFCGLIWLDPDLVVRQRAGKLVDFVPISEPVADAILPLHGCETDAQELRAGRRGRLEVSNVRIIGDNDDGLRLNFYLHWLDTSQRFLVIVLRTTTQSELEAELEKQSRLRAKLEAEAIEQSKLLRKTNKELVRANGELSQFANIISHDLKSPMRALRYQAEDIEEALQRGDSANAKARLGDLKQQARRMSRMLTDLLAYTRIGHTEEAYAEVDTRALMEAIVKSLPRPEGFSVDLAGDWPVMEVIEPALDLVVRNLLDNAIKHHDRPNGRVVIAAQSWPRGLEISVADDGPGIAPEHHAAVFQPFLKLASGATPETSGSGIGLSLVRKAAETAGAVLTLESDPGARRGTTFRLRWPGRIVT